MEHLKNNNQPTPGCILFLPLNVAFDIMYKLLCLRTWRGGRIQTHVKITQPPD